MDGLQNLDLSSLAATSLSPSVGGAFGWIKSPICVFLLPTVSSSFSCEDNRFRRERWAHDLEIPPPMMRSVLVCDRGMDIVSEIGVGGQFSGEQVGRV